MPTWRGAQTKVLIRGKCHCGNIAFDLQWPDEAVQIPARACGCSFCVKHGGVWTGNPAARLVVTVRDGARVSAYEFGTQTAQFQVCAICGAVPLVLSRIAHHLYAVVNVNTFEDVEDSALSRTGVDFDGEDLASRLARRQTHWIGDVRIVDRIR